MKKAIVVVLAFAIMASMTGCSGTLSEIMTTTSEDGTVSVSLVGKVAISAIVAGQLERHADYTDEIRTVALVLQGSLGSEEVVTLAQLKEILGNSVTSTFSDAELIAIINEFSASLVVAVQEYADQNDIAGTVIVFAKVVVDAVVTQTE